MQNSAYTKELNLTQLTCFIVLLKFIEMLWSQKKYQKNGVRRGLGQVRTKNVLAQTIPEKNICKKME